MKKGNSINKQTNYLSQLKGLSVISEKEGRIFGKVTDVYVDLYDKRIAGLVSKGVVWKNTSYFVPITEVDSIGNDVVLVKAGNSFKKITNVSSLKGMRLKNLLGHGVVSEDGEFIGNLTDAGFTNEQWVISELYLSDNKKLSIKAEEVTFGNDEIIVPSRYTRRVRANQNRKKNIFSKIFSKENYQKYLKVLKGNFSEKINIGD